MIDQTLLFDGTLPNTGIAVTATRVSTNVIDVLTARDIAAGNDITLNVLVTTAFTTTNSATLQVQFETCATAGGSYVALQLSPVYAASNLIAGSMLAKYVLAPNQLNNGTTGIIAAPGEFLRLTYTVGTGVFSAGAVMAWLTATPDQTRYYTYPKNYTAYVAAGEI